MKQGTREDLWKIGAEYGYDPSQVVGILRVNGYDGEFNPQLFGEYEGVIRRHAQITSNIKQKIENTPREETFDACPICGAPVTVKRGREPFGERWRCTAVVGHWAEWKWAPVRPYLQRNKDK